MSKTPKTTIDAASITEEVAQLNRLFAQPNRAAWKARMLGHLSKSREGDAWAKAVQDAWFTQPSSATAL